MNNPTTILRPGPSPSQLLLAQFCSVSLPPFNLAPQFLSRHAATATVLFRDVVNRNRYEPLPLDNSVERGWRHGGIND